MLVCIYIYIYIYMGEAVLSNCSIDNCLSNFDKRISSQKLESRNLSSMRVSNCIIPPSELRHLGIPAAHSVEVGERTRDALVGAGDVPWLRTNGVNTNANILIFDRLGKRYAQALLGR